MKNNIAVSVCVTTYNQELYIRDTIEGILKQKTNFEFEVIIHDDLSSDNTRKIIDEYAKKDKRIRKIYQKENQYSKGVHILPLVTCEAKGEYIAVCEGDDYWIDEYKLQKQYDFLQENQDCKVCFTNAKILNMKKNAIESMSPYDSDTKVTLKEYIKRKNSFPFASMMFRTKCITKYPKFFYIAPVGDIPLQIHLISQGYGYYMNEKMVVYRKFAQNSWTSNINSDKQKRLLHYNKMIEMYDQAIKELDECEKESILFMKNKAILKKEILMGNNKVIFDKKYKTALKSYTLTNRIKLFIKAIFPKTIESIKKKVR